MQLDPNFSIEKLQKGLACALAYSAVEGATKRLARARASLERAQRAQADPDSPATRTHTIDLWTDRVADIEAALETYNRRLGQAKIDAGFVS